MRKVISLLGLCTLAAGCASQEPQPLSEEDQARCVRLQAQYQYAASQGARSSVLEEARKLGCGTMVTQGSPMLEDNDHWKAMRERNIGVPGSGLPDTPREARGSSRTHAGSN